MTIKPDTRNAILDAAQDMVQRQSISGVSFQALASRVGIKKGSMYYHFESKDALSVALLERATQDLKTSFEQGKNKTACARLDYFFAIYNTFMKPGEKMCPGGAYAGEWETQAEPVRIQAQKLINAQIKGVQQILSDGLASAEFNDLEQNPQDLAQWIISSLQGALLISRVNGNNISFECSCRCIRQLLYDTAP